MTEALLVSNALLWLVVLVLAAVVAALVRQIGVLHERVAPAGALVGREGPRVGEAAPRLTVDDWNGAAVALGGPAPDGQRDVARVRLADLSGVQDDARDPRRGAAARAGAGAVAARQRRSARRA